ncbi:MAG: hypothetical protein CGU28_16940 [Candidatus Dactylopiibacterium carminicum]|uniref:Uncharacterized protein n=1 Tax=Candidatus Dactylopiibacterium carminicum TaxID=857335 RepID=A0A272EMJ3_9RHOO|nr:hypothetical protein [Candidatus Dactylopiibacterium carminicum]KAF7597737.1 hypothetical protein BGI27_17135 [Candidatus Dactylopiibacterium carminicum]PAS91337.1 MAG: hypothetical protein CGU29_17020 [Candidatus Dactylopiibacterium carminicum]PAS92200.1 MAG: hypothetical protein CGU28_16940 [Candidatus Dactylopiibacterium carminicum]PAS94985.1 MAG: hypothetical protein BSR46_17175 [Candidatus Dactylopiibacterium carminicum]
MSRLTRIAAGFRRAASARWLLRGGVLVLLAVIGSSVLQLWRTSSVVEEAAFRSDWGSEAIVAFTENARSISPIALANACGLGASSCFKCHNGARAEAPGSDPWHVQHKQVNFSCVGCHGGNSRLLKKEIAHTGLVANPANGPAQACAACHDPIGKPADLNLYKSTQASKGK